MPNQPAQTDLKAARMPVRQELAETAEIKWLLTEDKVEHPVRVWTATPQRALVLYFHGIESHGRWFEDTALALNKRGISVFAFDRRGAGSSRTLRGHVHSYRRLVDDADQILAQIRAANPGCPIFLVANCWGSKVALAMSNRKHNNDIRGIAITSPAVCVKVDVSFKTKVLIALSLLRGGKDYFDIPLLPEHFTEEPDYLDYIRRDPLRLTKATASFFFESIRLTRACKSSAKRMSLPLLVLQAGKDQIVNVEKTKQWFEQLEAPDKTMTMFTEAAHSLDFDKQAGAYQNALANWILERSAAPFLNPPQKPSVTQDKDKRTAELSQ